MAHGQVTRLAEGVDLARRRAVSAEIIEIAGRAVALGAVRRNNLRIILVPVGEGLCLDIGMSRSGNVGPTGERMPRPSVLLLSYTGCFTFMKWFELLRQEYDCPVAMLHVPYQADGTVHDHYRDYIVEQIQSEVMSA